ncbi:rap1 GTPase-GDP dissociation stimulator 1 isoform X2 [Colletes gigas]|uniref:rap1 GTPase-GDP dissociation stimulator 1 isoform X2 n=1 Tax=Colletes gigas TaxID=935657 RepID=UPI001C9B8B46|nr:rap1 GTPase-GDP dissociation stimulator 1 isoform X2 [Colletes gigas]
MEGELEHNIAKLVDDLRFVIKSEKENEDIVQILDSIANDSKTSVGEATEFMVDDVFLTLLHHESKDIIAKTAMAIAEIAKSRKGREKCTNTDLVNALIDLLKDDRIDVLTQTSRALGNICYKNVLEKSVMLKNVEGAPSLRNAAAGLLRNFLIDRSSLQKEALQQEKTIPNICSILEIDGTAGREAALRSLYILAILNDVKLEFLDERLTKILLDILDSDPSVELNEMCLEFLHGQAEYENSKLLLAKAGACELLLKLLMEYCPSFTYEKISWKLACSLIVLILTGDESMNYVYDNNNGIVYKKLVQWLESMNQYLQFTAVYAMGNFARTDVHCKLMVAQGVHRSLLNLLKNNNTTKTHETFQYALLGALRNLVIPAENKPIILEDGLLDVLCPILDIKSPIVLWELWATLRIVIDGQREAAIQLGKKSNFMKRLIEWCVLPGLPMGDAPRLLVWIINNSRNKEISLSVIKYGATRCLVKMLTAYHIVMRNEALISLIVLTTSCLPECEKFLFEAEIGEQLCRLFDTTNNLDTSILQNFVFLLDNITNSDVLREQLGKSNLRELCRNLVQDEENSTLRNRLEEICDKLN